MVKVLVGCSIVSIIADKDGSIPCSEIVLRNKTVLITHGDNYVNLATGYKQIIRVFRVDSCNSWIVFRLTEKAIPVSVDYRPRRGLPFPIYAEILGLRFAAPQALCFRLLRRLGSVTKKIVDTARKSLRRHHEKIPTELPVPHRCSKEIS